MEVPSDAPYSDQPWPQTEKNKAAMITRLDAYVGQLLDKLKELKIDDNTVVFFSSDNGPHKEGGVDPKFFQSGGPLRGIKRDLYEGGIRVPLIVRWPGKIKPGTVNDQPWAFWDFLPTAAEIAQRESRRRSSTASPCCRRCWASPKPTGTSSSTGNSTSAAFNRPCAWAIGRPCASSPARRSSFTT